MAKELFTIGYEGMSLDGFVAQLKNFAINCLIDVREIPLSRRPGFSKSGLAQRLDRENIHYVHFKELGSPKPIREKLKSDRNYSTFFKEMDKYLADKKEAIESVYNYVVNNTCCLMCFERLAAQCHRRIVARKIKERDGNGLRIKNI
jgi:uncharacterized protein (DUF488 family)